MFSAYVLEASVYFPESLLYEKKDLPYLQSFLARDSENLSYRIYQSSHEDKAIICLHGSGSHGEYLDDLASYLSREIGHVIVPNLRGHFGSGKIAGDCAYIGQLEDDVIDLMQELHLEGKKIYLVGHSSGGGLAIRLAGSPYNKYFSGYILLAPAIPTAPTMRKANEWADVSTLKIISLSILNGFGVNKFNHTPVISFHMPNEFQNGTETLSYTFNLNTSYHPRIPYDKDINALGDRYACFVGEEDELMEPLEYKNIIDAARIEIISTEKHLSIVLNQAVMGKIAVAIHDIDNAYKTIADPAVTVIPIIECGEPLIDLRDQNIIAFGPPPERPDNVCYTKMRKTVYDKLCEAQAMLPKGIRFCLYEGWRSLKLQGELFETMYANNQKSYPQMSPDELFIETTKLISPILLPDGIPNIPPHSTGAAIDVYLIDSHGKLLDMGMPLNQWSFDTGALLSQTYSAYISEEARKNRAIMMKVLSDVGFTNYPHEYWHWSYGDRYWAYQTKATHAIYNSVSHD